MHFNILPLNTEKEFVETLETIEQLESLTQSEVISKVVADIETVVHCAKQYVIDKAQFANEEERNAVIDAFLQKSGGLLEQLQALF